MKGKEVHSDSKNKDPERRPEGWELVGKPMHATVHYAYPGGTPYPRDDCRMCAAFIDGDLGEHLASLVADYELDAIRALLDSGEEYE